MELREILLPEPKRGEIVVRTRVASLNRGELLASIGFHSVSEPRPAGIDGAGEVHAVGEGVSGFRVGDRVMFRARGAFSEYVAAVVENLPEGRTSMLMDTEAGRPTEHDAIHGAVLRAADRHHIAVPTVRAVHGLLATRR